MLLPALTSTWVYPVALALSQCVLDLFEPRFEPVEAPKPLVVLVAGPQTNLNQPPLCPQDELTRRLQNSTSVLTDASRQRLRQQRTEVIHERRCPIKLLLPHFRRMQVMEFRHTETLQELRTGDALGRAPDRCTSGQCPYTTPR